MRVLWVLFAALVPGHVQDLSASGVHLSSRSLNLWPSACFYFISVGMAIKVSTFSPEYQPRAFKRDVGIMESGSSGEDEATRMRDVEGGSEWWRTKDKERRKEITDDGKNANHWRGLHSTLKSSSDSFAGSGLIVQHTWAPAWPQRQEGYKWKFLICSRSAPTCRLSLYSSDSDNWFYGAEEDSEIAAAAGVYILKMPSLDHGDRKKPPAHTHTHISSTCEDKPPRKSSPLS